MLCLLVQITLQLFIKLVKMKKLIIIILFFALNEKITGQVSTLQIKDLVLIPTTDTISNHSDSSNNAPKYYTLIAKINQISFSKKIYFLLGTAVNLEDVLNVTGVIQSSASSDGSSVNYSIRYNGQDYNFENYTIVMRIPAPPGSSNNSLVVTFYAEDNSGHFTDKLYFYLNP